MHRDVQLTFVMGSSASPSWPKAFKGFLTPWYVLMEFSFLAVAWLCDERRFWCAIQFAALTSLSDLGLVLGAARLALQD